MPSRTFDLQLPLWPAGVPSSLGDLPEDNPRIEVFQASNPNGAAVLICPGGGYGGRADHEGAPVARWLNTLGITGIVVHYRVAPYKHPQPLNDVTQAMRLTQQHAAEWKIDTARIGVLGFSAGGHLAATLSTLFEPDVRPAFSILLYPVITMGEYTHAGSRENLLSDPADASSIELLSLEKQVTPKTPPTFLFHTVDDAAVPIENAMQYATSLRTHGVPFEMHLYETGRHGVGLASDEPKLASWPALCASWLKWR